MIRHLAEGGAALARMARNRIRNLVDPPVVVLIYHRVATLERDPQLLAVTPENFRAQLSHLKEHYDLLRFEEEWPQRSRPAVAVTFDDGYADNLLQALPIIEELRVPVTFFVTTGMLGSSQEFWWDELERLILADGAFPAGFHLKDGNSERNWPTETAADREQLYREIHPLMKGAEAGRRQEWLAQLTAWSGRGAAGRPANRALTVAELQRLAESPWVTIGAHSISHCALAALPADGQRAEIAGSKLILEDLLGRPVQVFSYPFGGKRDYNGVSMALCREAGFVRAAANHPGQAHRWSNPYRIPRQLVRNWDLETFRKRMERFVIL